MSYTWQHVRADYTTKATTTDFQERNLNKLSELYYDNHSANSTATKGSFTLD